MVAHWGEDYLLDSHWEMCWALGWGQDWGNLWGFHLERHWG